MEIIYKNFYKTLCVRDYECDLQGIVNNAVYFSYLEHCRHTFFKSIGIEFASMHDEGKDIVVLKVNMKYVSPLKSGDSFIIRTDILEESNFKLKFNQKIYHYPSDILVLDAKTTLVCLKNNKPSINASIVDIVKKNLSLHNVKSEDRVLERNIENVRNSL